MRYLLLFITSAVLISCSSKAQPSKKEIEATAFEKELATGKVQLLDVRTMGEYRDGHIKNALLADWTNPTEFKERVQYLDKSQPILVYCASGVRSGQAAQWLTDNGFTTVENLRGGFTQWKLENKPADQIAATPRLSAQEYKQMISAAEVVLVEFGAEWCPPCRKMAPVITEIEQEQQENFKLVKINGSIDTDLMQEQHVAVLPTFIVYKAGKETWRKHGIIEKKELIAQLK